MDYSGCPFAVPRPPGRYGLMAEQNGVPAFPLLVLKFSSGYGIAR